LYEAYINDKNKYKLTQAPYGVADRANSSGQIETTRDPDCELSIFDSCCFSFYLIKYVEIIGVEPLIAILSEQKARERDLANSTQLPYHQKVRIVDFILESERALNVEDSSWRHCLLHLFLNGAITKQQFSNAFYENKAAVIP